MSNTTKPHAVFGKLLGIAPGGVGAYSSDYSTASPSEYPKRSAYRSYYDGIYMGYKWQCVEFARRWMYINKGYIFDDVAMAYDIFDLRSVRNIRNNKLLPLNAFSNGNLRHPEPGCLLIWKEGGEFERTGHVAVVTEVNNNFIRIAEQNVDHQIWPKNQNYARELTAKVTADGEYWVSCSYGDAEILGWMIQTEDNEFAEPSEPQNPKLSAIKSLITHTPSKKKAWLNIANPDEAAFVNFMGGHYLRCDEGERNRYLWLSNSAKKTLEHASNELHSMFMHATDYVLAHPELLEKFNLPQAILPKIVQSWDNRLNEVITSRFDFSLTTAGLKVYEYNCDSASCYMEAGKVQRLWFKNHGIDEGTEGGSELFKSLINAWKKSNAKGLVHILRDDDPEETYHALFMQQAINAAGLESKIIVGVNELRWNEKGQIEDADGEVIEWVWKTWAWETALEQIRHECGSYDGDNKSYEPSSKPGSRPKLSDVLFHKQVMVYEPLWSLIPSNKAILPVLWSIFPNHPLLLNASFTLTDELKQQGYVCKPIVGRCGANIALYGKQNKLLEATSGNFSEQETIYQQFFSLPKVAGYYTQISTFMAAGIYAGAGARVDHSRVMNKASDCIPILFIKDEFFLEKPDSGDEPEAVG